MKFTKQLTFNEQHYSYYNKLKRLEARGLGSPKLSEILNYWACNSERIFKLCEEHGNKYYDECLKIIEASDDKVNVRLSGLSHITAKDVNPVKIIDLDEVSCEMIAAIAHEYDIGLGDDGCLYLEEDYYPKIMNMLETKLGYKINDTNCSNKNV